MILILLSYLLKSFQVIGLFNKDLYLYPFLPPEKTGQVSERVQGSSFYGFRVVFSNVANFMFHTS